MRQSTLIALYGTKPTRLAELLGRCQIRIAETLGEQFSPYEMHQIHATIVGFEQAPGSELFNLNFQRYRGQSVRMDLHGFRSEILSSIRIPFSLQLSGFADRDYPFTSREQRPYDRSFSIQGDKAVVMGWPVHGEPMSEQPATRLATEARLYPRTLDEIRLSAQAYNVLHGYHRTANDVDNDFYFQIGLVSPRVDKFSQQKVENDIRYLLSAENPIVIEVGLSDLKVASYVDDTLPPCSTKAWPVADPILTDDFLSKLYK